MAALITLAEARAAHARVAAHPAVASPTPLLARAQARCPYLRGESPAVVRGPIPLCTRHSYPIRC